MAYIILSFKWMVFYVLHTLLASMKIKRKLRLVMGSSYKWYRLGYSIFSFVFILIILFYSATIPIVYALVPSEFLTYLGFVFAGIGTMICVKSFKGLSVNSFLGFIPQDDLHHIEPLHTKGLYEWVRHPMYAGLILIFLGYFLYLPYYSSLVHLVALLVYLPFGIYFEEKKLIELYGEQYREYQSRVPVIFPTRKP